MPQPTLSKQEIESVHFRYADFEQALARYPLDRMKPGWNEMADGERIFFIPSPSAGLWATRAKLMGRATRLHGVSRRDEWKGGKRTLAKARRRKESGDLEGMKWFRAVNSKSLAWHVAAREERTHAEPRSILGLGTDEIVLSQRVLVFVSEYSARMASCLNLCALAPLREIRLAASIIDPAASRPSLTGFSTHIQYVQDASNASFSRY